MAPAVSTFLSGTDWAGKTMVPFMTNGGWPGSVIDDMRDAAKGAAEGPALEVRFDSTGGSRQESSQREVDQWVASVKALL